MHRTPTSYNLQSSVQFSALPNPLPGRLLDSKPNSLDKRIIERRFDRSASQYDRYADVQTAMIHWFLNWAPVQNYINSLSAARQRPPIRLLDIGCGTGALTLEVVSKLPTNTEISLLDISPRMLQEAKSKLVNAGYTSERLHPIAADAEEWSRTYGVFDNINKETYHEHDSSSVLDHNNEHNSDNNRNFVSNDLHCNEFNDDCCEHYDIILSNAAFQWFNQPETTLNHLGKRLKPGGMLGFATFMPGTLRELHEACAYADKQLGMEEQARGQLYPTGEEWQTWLSKSESLNSSDATWMERDWILTYDSVEEVLRRVRRIGASNAMQQRSSMVNRTWLRHMIEFYENQFRTDDGKVILTYRAGFGSLLRSLP